MKCPENSHWYFAETLIWLLFVELKIQLESSVLRWNSLMKSIKLNLFGTHQVETFSSL